MNPMLFCHQPCVAKCYVLSQLVRRSNSDMSFLFTSRMRAMDWIFGNAVWVRRALNAWPPFWGAGIKIETLSKDFRFCRVILKSRWWNKNANGAQFGGSLFAMTDPIYPLMLMGYFENRHYVWDKAGTSRAQFLQCCNGVCISLCGGEAVQSGGLCSVLRNAITILERDAQVVLSVCIPLCRSKVP